MVQFRLTYRTCKYWLLSQCPLSDYYEEEEEFVNISTLISFIYLILFLNLDASKTSIFSYDGKIRLETRIGKKGRFSINYHNNLKHRYIYYQYFENGSDVYHIERDITKARYWLNKCKDNEIHQSN